MKVTKPALVLPMSDPKGLMFPHLERIKPILKTLFTNAFISVSASTYITQASAVEAVRSDPFFDVLCYEHDLPVGQDFATLYRTAAEKSPAEQILHLCYIDRLAFALETNYQHSLSHDIQVLAPTQTPLLYIRSEAAWATHPVLYQRIEGFVTEVCQYRLGETLDLAWCHMALKASDLLPILEHTYSDDISMVAEMVLLLRQKHRIYTKAVDWLAWEDPFIFQVDANVLRDEREHSQQELTKRLAYSLRMLEMLYHLQDTYS